jgi:hypothetical protein
MAVRLGVGEYELRERLFWAGDRLIPFAKNLLNEKDVLAAAERQGRRPARALAAASAWGRRPPKAGGGPTKYHQLAFRNSLTYPPTPSPPPQTEILLQA